MGRKELPVQHPAQDACSPCSPEAYRAVGGRGPGVGQSTSEDSEVGASLVQLRSPREACRGVGRSAGSVMWG